MLQHVSQLQKPVVEQPVVATDTGSFSLCISFVFISSVREWGKKATQRVVDTWAMALNAAQNVFKRLLPRCVKKQ